MDKTSYRFRLERYVPGQHTRHTCPKCGRARCFSRYIDADGLIAFPDEVGRCNHVNECGYHYTPAQFFADVRRGSISFENHTTSTPAITPPPPQKVFLDILACECCRPHFRNTELCAYLERMFGSERVQAVADLYKVGGYPGGFVVFPFIDEQGRLTTGKVLRYRGGHRGHDDNDTTYLHSLIRSREKATGAKSPLILRQVDAWSVSTNQCWFGAHLLPGRPDDAVAIVESEKTALMCAILQPELVWLATSSSNCFRNYRAPDLKGRSVFLYADANMVDDWTERSRSLECHSIEVVPWYVLEAPGSKRDIADLIEDVFLDRQQGNESSTAQDKAQLLNDCINLGFF